MSRVKIKVEGLSGLVEALRRVGEAGQDAVSAIVQDVTRETHDLATSRMQPGPSSKPGDYPSSQSGRLRSSVEMQIFDGKRVKGIVGSAAIHARFLEHGTASMEPRPWLMPSFEDAVDSVEAKLRAEFEARL